MQAAQHPPEQQWLQQLQNPATQEAAFRVLVATFQEPLYWHVRRMVGGHDDADDVLQNTFVKAWRNIGGFRGESRLKTWLYRIATNECLTFIEQAKRRSFSDVEDLGNDARLSHSGATLPEGEEIQRRLDVAVEDLPPKQRQVFVMKYFDEMTYEEIVDVLGGTVGSLKASFHHAVKKIEQSLSAT